MNTRTFHTLLTCFIAAVWLINGLFCKVLNLLPRHQAIVAGILGETHAPVLTLLIGLAETAMAIWILSKLYPILNSLVQIVVIVVMNILEFILVPDLLLWGKFNAIFAFLFVLLIWYNSFYLRPKTVHTASHVHSSEESSL